MGLARGGIQQGRREHSMVLPAPAAVGMLSVGALHKDAQGRRSHGRGSAEQQADEQDRQQQFCRTGHGALPSRIEYQSICSEGREHASCYEKNAYSILLEEWQAMDAEKPNRQKGGY